MKPEPPVQQQQIVQRQQPPLQIVMMMEPCGICMEEGHTEDMCPRMGDYTPEGEAEAYALQGFLQRQRMVPYQQRQMVPYQPQQQMQPYQQRAVNPYQQQQGQGWRNQPSGGWRNQFQGQNSGQSMQYQRPQQQQYQRQTTYYHRSQQQQMSPQPNPLEKQMRAFVQTYAQKVENTDAALKRLETRLGQLSSDMQELRQEKSEKFQSKQKRRMFWRWCKGQEQKKKKIAYLR